MSLIDDALKRAQAAQGGEKRPEAERRRLWTPAPLPDSGHIRRRKTLRRLVAAAGAAVAVAGVLVLLRHRAPEKTPAVLAAPIPLPSLPSGEGRGPRSKASAKEDEGKTAAKAAESRPTRAPMAAATPVSPGSSSSVQAAPPATVLPDRPTSLVNGKTYIGSVTLPGGARIELGGIVYSESNATALVNGKIVGPGAVIEGFLIQRIDESRLELSKSAGLTIYLALK